MIRRDHFELPQAFQGGLRLFKEFFFLLDVAIPTRRKVVVCDNILLVNPKLPAELVYLRLKGGDASLKLRKFSLSFLSSCSGLVGVLRNNLLELEPMNDLVMLQSICLQRRVFFL